MCVCLSAILLGKETADNTEQNKCIVAAQTAAMESEMKQPDVVMEDSARPKPAKKSVRVADCD